MGGPQQCGLRVDLSRRPYFEVAHRDSITRGLFDCRRSLHVATALVVRFLCELAVELAALHFTTALLHGFARYTASHFL